MGWVDTCVYCPGPIKDDEGNVHYLGQIVPDKGRMAKVRVPSDQTVPPVVPLTFQALHAVMFPELQGVAVG